MAPKKTNIKIKHSKFNLYNKKKSKARQALTVILTIAAACVLGVVGYGIGKPVLDYFRNGGQYTSDGSSDQSGSSDVSGVVEPGGSDGQSGSEDTGESAPESSLPDSSDVSAPAFDGTMYFLPDNAASSSASLNSALAAAKSAGATTVAVTLKDQKGNFLYKSGIAEIATSITGTLTAAQISDIITKAGFVPAARISTLMDSLNPTLVDASYEHSPTSPYSGGYWLDNRADRGGKVWLSPFKNNTATFLKKITSELTAAGFTHVICANTRFPAFFGNDITVYLNDLPLTDNAKRLAALWSVLDAIDASAGDKAQMWIEMDSAGLIAESKLGTDAEVCTDKTKLAASKIIISYTASGNAADAYKNAKDFAVKAKTELSGADVSVLIKGFSGSALSDVQRAFKEAELTVLVQ